MFSELVVFLVEPESVGAFHPDICRQVSVIHVHVLEVRFHLFPVSLESRESPEQVLGLGAVFFLQDRPGTLVVLQVHPDLGALEGHRSGILGGRRAVVFWVRFQHLDHGPEHFV